MRFRHLGRTGLRVSEICLGTMTFGREADREQAHRILDIAVEGGVNFFDSADVYSAGMSEEILGGWLQGRPREDYVVATKAAGRTGPGWNQRGLSRGHILDAVDASLRRLQTDYIDLYQLHAPDQSTPLEETLQALDDLVRWGKVRYVGCSNFPAWLLALAAGLSERHGWARLDSHQPRYNILYREIEGELLPLCQDQGIGVVAYNPLAGGFLTGKYRDPKGSAAGTRFEEPDGVHPLPRALLERGHVRGGRAATGALRQSRDCSRARGHRLGPRAAGYHLGDRGRHHAGADRRLAQGRRRHPDGRGPRRLRRRLVLTSPDARAAVPALTPQK